MMDALSREIGHLGFVTPAWGKKDPEITVGRVLNKEHKGFYENVLCLFVIFYVYNSCSIDTQCFFKFQTYQWYKPGEKLGVRSNFG